MGVVGLNTGLPTRVAGSQTGHYPGRRPLQIEAKGTSVAPQLFLKLVMEEALGIPGLVRDIASRLGCLNVGVVLWIDQCRSGDGGRWKDDLSPEVVTSCVVKAFAHKRQNPQVVWGLLCDESHNHVPEVGNADYVGYGDWVWSTTTAELASLASHACEGSVAIFFADGN